MRYIIFLLLSMSILVMGKINEGETLLISTKDDVIKSCITESMYSDTKRLDFTKIFSCENALETFNLFRENVLFFQELANTGSELYGIDSEEVQILKLYLAIAYLYLNNVDSANEIYTKIENGNNIFVTANLLNGKARYSYLLNDLSMSKNYLLESSKIQEKEQLTNRENYILTLSKLASIETSYHHYRKALEYMKKIETIMNDDGLVINDLLKVDILMSIGIIYENKDDLISARDAYLSALKANKRGYYNPQTVQTLAHLSNVLYSMGEIKKSLVIIEELFNIKKTIQYPDDLYVVNTYLLLSNYNHSTRDYLSEEINLNNVKNILDKAYISDIEKKDLKKLLRKRMKTLETLNFRVRCLSTI